MKLKKLEKKKSGKWNITYVMIFEDEYGKLIKIEIRSKKNLYAFIEILKNIMNMNKDEVSELIKEIIREAKEGED